MKKRKQNLKVKKSLTLGIIQSNIKDVYYGGTQEEWNAIEFGVDTYELQDATIYYYSETQPTGTGNYWHYDTDGITPIVW